jgi:hypothetical protein
VDAASGAPESIEGLLLCQVADNWLAFPARGVTRIDAWSENDVLAQHARWAFDLPRAPGKVLEEGSARLVVDALEIHSELAGLFPLPQVLVGAAGGALKGFVSAQARLWPLVEVARLCRYLADRPEPVAKETQ